MSYTITSTEDVIGAGIYEEGITCTLTAIQKENQIFSKWVSNGITVSITNPYSFVVTEDKTITPVYVEYRKEPNLPYTTHEKLLYLEEEHTIATTDWTALNGIYVATKQTEISDTTMFFAQLVTSTVRATIESELDAWSNIYKVTIEDGTLTLLALAVPGVDLNIKLLY